MIDVTKIPRIPTWRDIVIDANKCFSFFNVYNFDFVNGRIFDVTLIKPLNANHQRIKNVGAPTEKGDALSAGNSIPVSVGDAPFSFNDAVQTTTSTAMVKVKETRIWRPGTYRISFDLSSAQAGTWVFGIILRNGIGVGTLRQTNHNFWVTFTEDIGGWSVGDFVQLYARTGNPTIHCEIRNLRLFIHESDVTEKIMQER